MAGSLNKVTLIGNLGADPEIRTMNSGDRVVNLSVATSDSWTDRNSGERKTQTEWHRVVVFNQNLVNVLEKYTQKGSKLYIEGELKTRKWQDQSGQDKYTTEIVLRPYRGELVLLDRREQGDFAPANDFVSNQPADDALAAAAAPLTSTASNTAPDFDDEIPF